MNNPIFFDSSNSINLFGLQSNFDFLTKLYENKNLPKVLMLTGEKGSGKSTLINHFLFSIFDSSNYNRKEFCLSESSYLLKQLKGNIFSNIIYIKGADFQSVKVEDIRNLKNKIFRSTILNKERFIILDDVELFNINSLNALLKIIEEPSNKNYFILINNKSKPLLDTIKSRTLEILINLKEKQRKEIIGNLIDFFHLELFLDPKILFLTPGNFIKFNHICGENKIFPNNNLIENLSLLFNLYKKNKNIIFINLAFFFAEYYLNDLKVRNIAKTEKIYELKNYIFKNLNNFLLYNLSHNSVLNDLNSRIIYE